MAVKQFQVDQVGTISVQKRRGSRNLRLRIDAHGAVKVTIPAWAPYTSALSFVASRREWIMQQRPAAAQYLDGQRIGKFHHLALIPDPAAKTITTRVGQTAVSVRYPAHLPPDDVILHAKIKAAGARALRAQAEQLLPGRLQTLAARHGFSYRSVSVKQLKGRWGSCDSRQNIVLNLFLMQLPWECIDYVLLHELTHTRVMRHGPPFWQAMAEVCPDVQHLRKAVRSHQPTLQGSS